MIGSSAEENLGHVNTSGPHSNTASNSGDCLLLVGVDRPFVVHLWEDRTRGEQWVPSYEPNRLALLSDEFLRVASNNAVENGQRIFEFKAVTPGVHELVFEKRMGWKFTAEDRRVFRIEVSNHSES